MISVLLSYWDGWISYRYWRKPKFHLARHIMSQHNSTRSTCRASRDERVEACCSNIADDEQAVVLACTSLVVFMLLHTQTLFVPWITLYKLHNELSCESRLLLSSSSVSSHSSSSCRVRRAVLYDKLDTAKLHGLNTSNVSSSVVSRRDEPSAIWLYPVKSGMLKPCENGCSTASCNAALLCSTLQTGPAFSLSRSPSPCNIMIS